MICQSCCRLQLRKGHTAYEQREFRGAIRCFSIALEATSVGCVYDHATGRVGTIPNGGAGMKGVTCESDRLEAQSDTHASLIEPSTTAHRPKHDASPDMTTDTVGDEPYTICTSDQFHFMHAMSPVLHRGPYSLAFPLDDVALLDGNEKLKIDADLGRLNVAASKDAPTKHTTQTMLVADILQDHTRDSSESRELDAGIHTCELCGGRYSADGYEQTHTLRWPDKRRLAADEPSRINRTETRVYVKQDNTGDLPSGDTTSASDSDGKVGECSIELCGGVILALFADLCDAHYALCEYAAGVARADDCERYMHSHPAGVGTGAMSSNDASVAARQPHHTCWDRESTDERVCEKESMRINKTRVYLAKSKCLYELLRLDESLAQADLAIKVYQNISDTSAKHSAPTTGAASQSQTTAHAWNQTHTTTHTCNRSQTTTHTCNKTQTTTHIGNKAQARSQTRLLSDARVQLQLVKTTLTERRQGVFDLEALLASSSGAMHHRHRAYIGPAKTTEILGKGRGLVATRDILRGELVTAGYPLASVAVTRERDGVDALGKVLHEQAKRDAGFAEVLGRLFGSRVCGAVTESIGAGASSGEHVSDGSGNGVTSHGGDTRVVGDGVHAAAVGRNESASVAGKEADTRNSNSTGMMNAIRVSNRAHAETLPGTSWKVPPLEACKDVVRMNAFSCEQGLHKTQLHEFQSAAAPERIDVCSVYDHISYLNHACASNTTRMIVKGLHMVRARCDIKRGEEVTTAYAESDHTAQRWEFECVCEYCVLVPSLPREVLQATATCDELGNRVTVCIDRGEGVSSVMIDLLRETIACVTTHLVRYFDTLARDGRDCSPAVQAKIVHTYLMRPSFILYNVLKRKLDAEKASHEATAQHPRPKGNTQPHRTDPRAAFDVLINSLSVLQDPFDTWDSSVFMSLVGESMRMLLVAGAGALPTIEHYLEMAVQAEIDVIGDYPEWAYGNVKRQAQVSLGLPASVIDRILLSD
ncbi:hypothetical protein SARC_09048 [Sphaeroforma arctica JP610]|uniref:SET domain-containing protein n=1 Tax=Sphaeroforma arctica JP610 TaxID=667725 RepID=A0A0L0FR97_9EUKA|nr:hypothetical protein SARC_09048 [Sphaeroforma arctica JP610]KNC78523.1 hypothetical protein SARC_09048 [Sphaeroforma arctica JP610]|eukprot:XP_014152425.1 hypothetical protein SARC_09048 [Sphaeroforma arctica JP610]